MNKFVLECKSLGKTFIDGKNQLRVLHDINLEIASGAQVAIMGRSGSGKSTLLQLLAGLDAPTNGKVYVHGKDIMSLNEAQRARLRNKYMGFIYQMHHLLPEFTALENVALPMLMSKHSVHEAMSKAKMLIKAVGLTDRSDHRPAQLSGGERQRIAVARSLVMRPQCVLADEPTGNLDADNAALAMQLMRELNRELGTTFVVVTHDPDLAASLDYTLHLQDGMLIDASTLCRA